MSASNGVLLTPAERRAFRASRGLCIACASPLSEAERLHAWIACNECIDNRNRREAAKPAPIPSALVANLAARNRRVAAPVNTFAVATIAHACTSCGKGLALADVSVLDGVKLCRPCADRISQANKLPAKVEVKIARAPTENEKALARVLNAKPVTVVPVKSKPSEREKISALSVAHQAVMAREIPENERPAACMAFMRAWLDLDAGSKRFLLLDLD